ncbi:MAG TPA: flagellar biosynthetic protein FliO [Symbiobacteriaceae bacterium]|nr:flagellar biosynthetic protein FliO [Symbiobacteriaceae bacterium]
MGESFLQLLQAVFLFGLVLGLAWLSTRMIGYRMGLASRGRMVRVLENVPAGRDRSIMLLEVGGRIYLVGSTGERISLIDAIEDPEVIERLMAQTPPVQPNPLEAMIPASFRDVLSKVRGGGQQPVPPAEPDSTEERLQQQLDRLRRLQEKEK